MALGINTPSIIVAMSFDHHSPSDPYSDWAGQRHFDDAKI